MLLNKVIILVFLAPILVNAFLDYDNVTNVCYKTSSEQEATEAQIFHSFILHKIDMYTFLIVCPFCFIFILMTASVYIIQPRTRQMPGDIIFMLLISDLCLLGKWISTSIYYLIHEPAKYPENEIPASFDTFCDVSGFFGIIGGTGEFVYNCIFCVFMIIQIRVGIKKGQLNTTFRGIVYHVTALFIISVITILAFSTGKIGLSVYGTCSISSMETSPLIDIVFVFFYFCLSLATVSYFGAQIPNEEVFKKYRNTFLVYYNKYLISTVVIWGVLSLSNLILTINCKLATPIQVLSLSVTIGNLAKLTTPIVLCVIRYQNPTIKPVMNRLFKLIFCFFCNKEEEDSYERSFIEEQETSSIELNWFNQITHSLRFCKIYTILYGINIYAKKMESSKGQILQEELKEILKQKLIINIQKSIKSEVSKLEEKIGQLDQESVHVVPDESHILDMKMIVYAPRIFQEFLRFDKLSLQQILQSVDLGKNNKILDNEDKEQNGDGGASGQFFLFTHDDRLILKTMKESQLNVYLKNLQNFYSHYCEHSECLITKFYGIFSFSLSSRQDNIHILLTKNVNMVIAPVIPAIKKQQKKQKYVRAVYDLKGSSYNREVLNKNNENPKKKVLKDIDFQKEEKYISISLEQRVKYKKILSEDSIFFKNMNIIDYSLIVGKVEEKGLSREEQQVLGNAASTRELNIWYRMGIIDYLQEWNKKKKLERTTKIVIHRNLKLDTSAQDPVTYSNRFIMNVLNRIFPVENSQS